MAQNLNYKVTSSFCYNGKDVNCEDYGRLYAWSTAQDVCPDGWHLPSNKEWEETIKAVGDSAAYKLKSAFGWNKDGNGIDKYGFAVLPAGYKTDDEYAELNKYAAFWSSDYFDASNAYSWRFISAENETIKKNSLSKTIARSVRCVNDKKLNSPYDYEVREYSDLSKYRCVAAEEGKTAYVEDDDEEYICYYDEDYDMYGWEIKSTLSSSSAKVSSSSVAVSSSSAKVSSSSVAVSSSSAKVSSSSVAVSSSSVKASSSSVAVSSSSVKASSSSVAVSSSSVKASSSSVAVSSSSAKVSSSSAAVSSSSAIITGTMTDSRDGNVYKTVTIGTTTWMAQDLNYSDVDATPSLSYRNWCFETDDCASRGRLYSYAAAIDSALLAANGYTYGDGIKTGPSKSVQGICPDGWHLPTKAEYEALITYASGTAKAGKLLKTVKHNGTDAYGFSMNLNGTRVDYNDLSYQHQKYDTTGSYWTSNNVSAHEGAVFAATLKSDSAYIGTTFYKFFGASVRCVEGDAELVIDRTKKVSPFTHSMVDGTSDYDASTNTLVDNRDGKTYKTTTIGSQVWMAQNLNYLYETDPATSFCYEDDPDSCDTYGRLYTWAAAMDSVGVFSSDGEGCGWGIDCSAQQQVRGVCPQGWHLPSTADWDELIETLGVDRGLAGQLLKSTDWKGTNEDSYGFSANFTGRRASGGHNYSMLDTYASYWNSDAPEKESDHRNHTEANETQIMNNEMMKTLIPAHWDKSGALGVRCLKD